MSEKNVIVIGGVYKTHDGWVLVNKKLSNGRYLIHDIMIDDGDYDDDISEITEKELREMIVDINKIYVGKFKKNCLYAVQEIVMGWRE